MKSIDHKLLTDYLLDNNDFMALHHHKRAFMFGCIEPDINFFTYARGFIKNRSFTGHHTKNTKRLILQCMIKLQNCGVQTFIDFFALGTLIHYIADSFTYPHTELWDGTIREHMSYEVGLHDCFMKSVQINSGAAINPVHEGFPKYLEDYRTDYNACKPSLLNDCNHIITACQTALGCVLRRYKYI